MYKLTENMANEMQRLLSHPRLRTDIYARFHGDDGKPQHRPECQCDSCEDWRWQNGRTVYLVGTIIRNKG